ncbi:MAG: hypothetical protein ACE5HI_02605 [bacterium]
MGLKRTKRFAAFTAVFLIGIFTNRCNDGSEIVDTENSNNQITILNPTPSSQDKFGWSLAMNQDRIAVGTPGDGTAGIFMSGAVYLFELSKGDLIKSFISPSIAAAGSRFGQSVAIVGNNLLVGAPGDTITDIEEAGAAYLFNLNTGELIHKFFSPTPKENEFFGYSVAGTGDDVLVGTLNFNKAYLFDAVSKTLLHTFTLPPGSGNDNQQFGYQLATFDNSVIISARKGSIYLFDSTSGSLVHTFTSTDNKNSDFGFSLAGNGNNLLVGSPTDNLAGDRTGAAFLFDVSTGSTIQTFLNPSPEPEDMFGISVAILGDKVIIGASGDNTGATNSGSVYLFDKNTGALLDTISNPTPAVNDNFGYSIVPSQNRLTIGAWGSDDAGASQSGAVYVFDL